MPTSLEELERKLDALSAENATLRRRLTDLEESVDGHVGIDYGAAQQLSPHPSQQIEVAEFGGGIMRLDKNGIQVLAPDISTIPSILFVQRFSETPETTYPVSQLQGYANIDNTFIGVVSAYSVNKTTEFYVQATSTNNRIVWAMNSGGAPIGQIDFFQQGTASIVSIGNGASLHLDPKASDPVIWGDGQEWYRSDIDRYRVYANGITRNLTMDGTNTTLTIATGAVTITTSFHAIDTEGAAATDDLDTINGGQTGQVLYLHAANGARDVVAKDGTGNLKLAGDFTMNNAEDVLTLIFDGSSWLELSRSDNGA